MARYALVGRSTPDDMTPERRADMVAWLTALDVDPALIRDGYVAVVQNADLSYWLHLTEFVLDERGKKFIDFASDLVVSTPRRIEITEGSWPSWLTALGVPVREG